MSKFGADLETTSGVPIRMGKYGPAHAIQQYGGSYFLCRRQVELCKVCAEHGVPLYPPDPFDVALQLLTDNWGKRWIESDRQSGPLGDNEIWPADGIHILAVDDETGARTVVASFGENDTAMGTISALVAAHNIMIGRPD
ncbi:MAG: hypothetical protein U9R64_01690 [Pseudomonadota bacterium]|nr:hypothetical protein [Pseudomonadota bacterium]